MDDETRGERTRLRPLDESDLGRLVEWRNRHRLRFVDSSPIALEGQGEWYASHCRRDNDLMYIIETPDGRPVGCVSLYHIAREAGTAEFGRLMIGSASDEGRGFALDACCALLDRAATALGLRRVHLQIRADNQEVVPFYERLGFSRDPSHDGIVERQGARIELLGMSRSLDPAAGLRTPDPSSRPEPPIRVAVVLPGIVPSTHIRILSPLSWLVSQGHITLTVIAEAELERPRGRGALRALRHHSRHKNARLGAEKSLAEADVVIIQRSTSRAGERAVEAARAVNAAVIYETDDNFLLVRRDTPLIGEYYNKPGVRRRFLALLASADVVTTTTGFLADCFRESTADVRILPSCVDFSHVDADRRPSPSSGFVIGYAGTVTHGPDFECVEPALRRVLEESRGEVRLQFFGFAPPALVGLPNVDFVPYTSDYPTFLRTLGKVDWSFAIAPLADLPSGRGKSDNKYREYGACRIPAVYSDCPTYSSSVVQGRTGLLVPHTEDGWYEGIRQIMADAHLRERIAHEAYEDVVIRYSVAAAAQAWLETFREILSRARR